MELLFYTLSLVTAGVAIMLIMKMVRSKSDPVMKGCVITLLVILGVIACVILLLLGMCSHPAVYRHY